MYFHSGRSLPLPRVRKCGLCPWSPSGIYHLARMLLCFAQNERRSMATHEQTHMDHCKMVRASSFIYSPAATPDPEWCWCCCTRNEPSPIDNIVASCLYDNAWMSHMGIRGGTATGIPARSIGKFPMRNELHEPENQFNYQSLPHMTFRWHIS